MSNYYNNYFRGSPIYYSPAANPYFRFDCNYGYGTTYGFGGGYRTYHNGFVQPCCGAGYKNNNNYQWYNAWNHSNGGNPSVNSNPWALY